MKNSVRFITRSALIAALYLALSVAFQAISFGPIQFRVSEILVLLPLILVEAIPGLTIGCFLTNFFFSPYGMYDALFGAIATLIAAILTFVLRKNYILAAIPPIVLNALIVPIVFVVENSGIYYIAMGQIALSQLIVAIIAIPFTLLLKKAFIKARINTSYHNRYDSDPYYREDRNHQDIID